jgi:hypothetical protein
MNRNVFFNIHLNDCKVSIGGNEFEFEAKNKKYKKKSKNNKKKKVRNKWVECIVLMLTIIVKLLL